MSSMIMIPLFRRCRTFLAVAATLAWFPCTPVLVGSLTSDSITVATEGDIRDKAGLLSVETIARANAITADIRANTKAHRTVVVETFPELPAGAKDVDAFSKSEFTRLAVNGVLVVIIKKPGNLRIRVDQTTILRFTLDGDVKEMSALMLTPLKQAKYDEAVLAGLVYAQTALKKEFPFGSAVTPAHQPLSGRNDGLGAAREEQGLPSWVWIVIAVVGCMLLMRILGGLLGRGAQAPTGSALGGGAVGGGGGGGFMTSMFGGIFGAVAGNWIYNNMFGGPSNSGGYDSGGGGADFNSDAGNAADQAGGGDFGGGGDAGGGDFGGGGDSGGGGGE